MAGQPTTAAALPAVLRAYTCFYLRSSLVSDFWKERRRKNKWLLIETDVAFLLNLDGCYTQEKSDCVRVSVR